MYMGKDGEMGVGGDRGAESEVQAQGHAFHVHVHGVLMKKG